MALGLLSRCMQEPQRPHLAARWDYFVQQERCDGGPSCGGLDQGCAAIKADLGKPGLFLMPPQKHALAQTPGRNQHQTRCTRFRNTTAPSVSTVTLYQLALPGGSLDLQGLGFGVVLK